MLAVDGGYPSRFLACLCGPCVARASAGAVKTVGGSGSGFALPKCRDRANFRTAAFRPIPGRSRVLGERGQTLLEFVEVAREGLEGLFNGLVNGEQVQLSADVKAL